MKDQMFRRLLASPVLALTLAASPAIACSTADIQIKQINMIHDELSDYPDNHVSFVGELVNKCNQAIGPEFHITLRDSAGQVIGATDRWPADTKQYSSSQQL
jgi:hypothetical protein